MVCSRRAITPKESSRIVDYDGLAKRRMRSSPALSPSLGLPNEITRGSVFSSHLARCLESVRIGCIFVSSAPSQDLAMLEWLYVDDTRYRPCCPKSKPRQGFCRRRRALPYPVSFGSAARTLRSQPEPVWQCETPRNVLAEDARDLPFDLLPRARSSDTHTKGHNQRSDLYDGSHYCSDKHWLYSLWRWWRSNAPNAATPRASVALWPIPRRRTRGLTGHDPCMQIIGRPLSQTRENRCFRYHRRVYACLFSDVCSCDLKEAGDWTLVQRISGSTACLNDTPG